MDVIKITVKELRDIAHLLGMECARWRDVHSSSQDSDDRQYCREQHDRCNTHRIKLRLLSDRMEGLGLDSLEFRSQGAVRLKVWGVQA